MPINWKALERLRNKMRLALEKKKKYVRMPPLFKRAREIFDEYKKIKKQGITIERLEKGREELLRDIDDLRKTMEEGLGIIDFDQQVAFDEYSLGWVGQEVLGSNWIVAELANLSINLAKVERALYVLRTSKKLQSGSLEAFADGIKMIKNWPNFKRSIENEIKEMEKWKKNAEKNLRDAGLPTNLDRAFEHMRTHEEALKEVEEFMIKNKIDPNKITDPRKRNELMQAVYDATTALQRLILARKSKKNKETIKRLEDKYWEKLKNLSDLYKRLTST